jgi:hypothetical protein
VWIKGRALQLAIEAADRVAEILENSHEIPLTSGEGSLLLLHRVLLIEPFCF